MIDEQFCELLEYHISQAFANSQNGQVTHFWCDGVLLPTFENEYSKKTVNDTRRVMLTAFTGLTGQEKYELTLIFGNKALGRYAKDLDISDCLTNVEESFFVDIANKKIWIQLS